VDSKHELRSGWKFAAYSLLLIILFVVVGVALGIFAALLDPSILLLPRENIRFLGLNAVVLFFPSLLTVFMMARFVDRVPISVFGLSFHTGWFRDLLLGVAFAAAMVVAVMGAAALFGGVDVRWSASGMAAQAIATIAVLSIAAFNEELVFRGYPLQIFLKGIGPLAAMLLISFLFALLHVRNDGATWLSTVNTVIAGVFLSRAYLQTRSIWLPYGIHVGWNVGTAVVVGVPVSGIDTASFLKTQIGGSPIISGGEYGPENSLLGTLVFLAGALLIRRLAIGNVSPEIQTALKEHEEKVYIES
jgi:membrane protease YdiL (CAAX protease family)